jgi:hypothetical protein
MARIISRAESWERVHEVFSQITFTSFDFNTIKNSLLDYVKLYFPEDFNDYIESSEFIAILELFAYVGELLSYRLDLNAHENFITTAERKESILRLAKLISYNASRTLPARGIVKIASIQTTETVIDSQGRDISSRKVIWNDKNNSDWKEQFLLIMNRVLEQDFGTVAPSERVQMDNVIFELYSWNNSPLNANGLTVFPYSASVTGKGYPMELVPVSLDETGPSEKRPERNVSFSLLYGNDGLGDGSSTTGFFCFTKQGELKLSELTFDGITPNQTFDITEENVNDTDVWLNNVNADTRELIVNDPYSSFTPHIASDSTRYGEWVKVDLANAQNIIFNTNKNRKKYEVETLDKDAARLVFGDGEFSNIPSGAFDMWYRVSNAGDLSIPKTAISEKLAAFTYVDAIGTVQTLTFTFSLISTLQNGSKSEDVEHIRRVAPAVYYTQDRMVNGRDYNEFMLQDPSILKLRSINRTFAGDSKYIAWHDPKEYYENVKMFGNDLAWYIDGSDPVQGNSVVIGTAIGASDLMANYIQPLLCSTDFFVTLAPIFEQNNLNPTNIRCQFSLEPYSFEPETNEVTAILAALSVAATTTPVVDLYYSVAYDEWTVGAHPVDNVSMWMIRVDAQFAGDTLSGWVVRWTNKRFVVQSNDSKFWSTNETNSVIDYDTLHSNADKIVILQANANSERTGLLFRNLNYNVVAQELVEQNLPNAGLPDIHRLSILPTDQNDDGVPDNMSQLELLNASYVGTYTEFTVDEDYPDEIIFPHDRTLVQITTDQMDYDLNVYVNDVLVTFGAGSLDVGTQGDSSILSRVKIVNVQPTDVVKMVFVEYVYFVRESSTDDWVPVATTTDIQIPWILETTTIADEKHFKRHEGRYPLNFAWFHYALQHHLINPSATNIIDTYIISRGYYNSVSQWLANATDIEPDAPTPLDLRTSYANLLDNKMISDTVILHPGRLKLLFGPRANPELRAVFKIIRPINTNLTDNEVKVRIVAITRTFFNLQDWEFGETFFFTELAAAIHAELGPEIDSVVLVPTFTHSQFGDLFQVQAKEDELFVPDINSTDIQVVQLYTPENIHQNEPDFSRYTVNG